MKIFTTEYRKMLIGIISLIFILFIKWWLVIIPLVCLIFLKPPTDKDLKDVPDWFKYQKNCFYIILCMPVLALLLNARGNYMETVQIEKEQQQLIVQAQKEQERIDGALVWNIDDDPSLNEEEKVFVKAAADNLIANEKTCNKLTMGGGSTLYKDKYYLQCKTRSGGYFKIYFTEDDINNERVLKIIEPYSKNEVTEICFQRQWSAIKFPDTMKTISWRKDVKYTNGDTKQEQVFSAKNAYGMAIRYRSVCIVNSNGRVVEFKIIEE